MLFVQLAELMLMEKQSSHHPRKAFKRVFSGPGKAMEIDKIMEKFCGVIFFSCTQFQSISLAKKDWKCSNSLVRKCENTGECFKAFTYEVPP